MNLFFDTSALVKFFHEEEGTGAVTDLILDANNQVWSSELARLEFLSTVFRRFRNKELDEKRLNTAVNSFENQVDSFNIELLGHAVLDEAALLLKDGYIRISQLAESSWNQFNTGFSSCLQCTKF